MEKVQFTELDASILYCMAKIGTHLVDIINNYTFMQRTYAPSYKELADCLNKSIAVGIIEKKGDQYLFNEDWCERMHKADKISKYEFESLSVFSDDLIDHKWDKLNDTEFTLDKDEYRTAIRHHKARNALIFGAQLERFAPHYVLDKGQFSETDADVLHGMPAGEVGIEEIVQIYCDVFKGFNEPTPPASKELSDCLEKSLNVGVIERRGDKFIIEKEWYERIHRGDFIIMPYWISSDMTFLLDKTWEEKKRVRVWVIS